LRWFTPTAEMDLCGHATLASAHALWEEGHLPSSAQARFHTRSGLLTADRDGDWIQMNFPSIVAEPIEAPAALVAALGVTPRSVSKADSYLVEFASEAEVRAVRPNFAALAELPAVGTIVTAPAAAGEYDFVSRFFAPRVGIDEDPVTGAAHSYLTPFWTARLGKRKMVGYQASKRGGVIRVRLDGDRVWISGQAVTTLRGELTV
jgi:PhzF family phenazine biosynthesis protein